MLRSEIGKWLYAADDKAAIKETSCGEIVTYSYKSLAENIIAKAYEFEKMTEKNFMMFGENGMDFISAFLALMLAGKNVFLADLLMNEDEINMAFVKSESEAVLITEALFDIEDIVKPATAVYYDKIRPLEDKLDLSDIKSESYGSLILMTSGTTSHAKYVVGGFTDFMKSAEACIKAYYFDGCESVYTPLPTHHIYGQVVNWIALTVGVTICVGNPRSLEQDVVSYKPNVLAVVPSILEFLCFKGLLKDPIKYAVVAGTKCEERIEALCKKQGIFLQNFYGASEALGAMAVSYKGYRFDQLMAVPGIELWVSEEGELMAKSEHFMNCYLNEPEKTKAKIDNNIMHTGDAATMDSEGIITILGRIDDMIAMENGDKIFCGELDEILSAYEGVKEAAVVYEDKKLIAVFSLESEEYKESVEKKFEDYNSSLQRLRRFSKAVFTDKIFPRTSLGKLKRNMLLQQ